MPLGFFGNASGSYASAIPFQRIVEPAQLGMFLNLEQAELLRIQRYGEHQRFYLGKQWTFKREDGEPLATVNYFRKLIDKSVEFLMGAGFSINVADALVETTLPLLREVWEANNAPQLSWDIGVMGAVTGDVFVLVTYEEPSAMAKRINPFSQGRIRINLLGSEQVFPVWDPLNVEILSSVRIETIFFAERGMHQLNNDDKSHMGRTLYTKRFTQIITPAQIVEQMHGDQPVIKPNLLGEIPLVHIKNISMPKEYYGIPDGLDIVDLQRQYNETTTDASDSINYGIHPVTVVFGGKTKNLERGPGQIWGGLNSDARVEQLPPMTSVADALPFLDRKKKEMCELADVPEGSLGQMQPISNTSGVALSMMFQPLKAKTERKRNNYGPGLESVNYFILRIASVMGLIRLPFDICKECGGRIVETLTGEQHYEWMPDANNPQGGSYALVPTRKKRCFLIDKNTFDFEKPENVRLKFVRQYGFGSEVREAPFWSIEREMKNGKPSFWDYAKNDLKAQQDHTNAVKTHAEENPPQVEQQTDAEGNPVGTPPEPAPVPPVRETQVLPSEFVDVPAEPENVVVVHTLRNPATAEVMNEWTQTMFLVPTDCQHPKYLNPFENEVEFHDVLPKDQALEAQKYTVYQQGGWVDPVWIREQIPEIKKDAAEIEKRMKSSSQVNPQNQAGGFQQAPQTGGSQQGSPSTYQEQAPPDQHPEGEPETSYGGRPTGTTKE